MEKVNKQNGRYKYNKTADINKIKCFLADTNSKSKQSSQRRDAPEPNKNNNQLLQIQNQNKLSGGAKEQTQANMVVCYSINCGRA